jgi:hypothetical protein
MLGRAWLQENVTRRRISQEYAQVIQSCLTSAFFPVPSGMSLVDKDFREAVYHQIVIPLEREYLQVQNKLKLLDDQSEDEVDSE